MLVLQNMDQESSKGFSFGRVSFSSPRSIPSQMKNERLGKLRGASKDVDNMAKEKALLSSCCFPFDSTTPKSPIQAMEFLSRSWSPSSSDFFQMLSTNKLLLPLNDQKENDEGVERKQIITNKDKILWRKSSTGMSMEHIWRNAGKMKAWFGGELLSSFSRRHNQKRKEEVRLHMAEIHAALSIAQLAAAVAGIVANGGFDLPTDTHSSSNNKKIIGSTCEGSWNNNMGQAVASAAALLATVCAEAAESAGAKRSHIASAMDLGLATQNPSDMLAVAATAATCLRGAATLKLRAKARSRVSEDQEILARGTQLPIRAPSGKVQVMVVSIYIKHDMLGLRLGKKYLQGAITRHKEYRIIHVIEDRRDGGWFSQDMCGFCLLTLGTTGGTIQLLFGDEKQRITWKSSISHLLSYTKASSLVLSPKS